MSVTVTAVEIPKGTTLGKYEILRKLATGGMAEIYLARVRGIDGFEKLVVLKRILPNVAEDPNFVQMFLDEARLAATLQHPNIADVYDVGTEDKTYFFTMEFIHGEDARTIRITTKKTGQPLPLPHALAIVHGTASALSYAHAKTGAKGPLGLVHRDVSSSNILVSFDGAVKLVDFGIARATSRQTKTRTGTLKGKIPYMSPEQCQNRPLDRRSDLFSLGVVLYELTLGRRPFRGDSDFAILDQIINRGAPRPSSIDPSYPAELERIVMKLLARPAAERYQSGEDLLHDLEEFMSANNAWTSPIKLGRYMRQLFPDKVKAWEQAAEVGTSLGDFVAQTITSESLRAAQRITPVSAFTAQPEIPVEGGDGAEPTTLLPTGSSTPAPAASLPALRSTSKAWMWLAIVTAVVCAAVMVVVFATRGDKDKIAAPTVEAVKAVTAPTPASAPGPTPTPTVAPVAPATPTVAPTTATVAPTTPTVAPTAPTTPTVAPVAPTLPTVASGSATTPAATANPGKPRTVKVTKPPVKTDKKPVKTDKPTKDKEPTWDPNSPFLPGT
jgi:serine/threonine protein kinase